MEITKITIRVPKAFKKKQKANAKKEGKTLQDYIINKLK